MMTITHGDHDDHHDDDFDAQSMENMGGLASKMPLTATAMLVGSASIMGLPLIGGFWSKEGIMANAWRVALEDPRFFLPAMCVLIGAGMTGFYMSRMWLKTFAGKPKTEGCSTCRSNKYMDQNTAIHSNIYNSIGNIVCRNGLYSLGSRQQNMVYV